MYVVGVEGRKVKSYRLSLAHLLVDRQWEGQDRSNVVEGICLHGWIRRRIRCMIEYERAFLPFHQYCLPLDIQFHQIVTLVEFVAVWDILKYRFDAPFCGVPKSSDIFDLSY